MALSGCSVYIYGIEGPSKKALVTAIRENGGQVSSILGLKTTHLVTVLDKVSDMGYNIKKALQNNTQVVSPDWVLHSAQAKRKLDTDKYNLCDNVGTASTVSSGSLNLSSTTTASSTPAKIVPTINSIIPDHGNQNNLKICIIGKNFNPSGVDMAVKVGAIEISQKDIEVYSPTLLVVSVPDNPPLSHGNAWVQVSSDGGNTFGSGANFTFVAHTVASGTFAHDYHGDPDSREIKIFLSSPFRDMQLERDWIVKWAIPKLRKLCSDRDVVLTYVDLRWGVTDIQSAKATTLLMCLRELRRCNIFVGCYGQRYGWAVSTAPMQEESNQLLARTFDSAVSEFPWIGKYRDRSVTEVEMRGILDKEVRMPSFFYFRDTKFIDTVPAFDRHKYQSEGPDETSKLDKLKKDIRTSAFPSSDYTDPKIMAEKFYDDIEKYINQKFPSTNILTINQGESGIHETYSKCLARVYAANQKYFFLLDKHVANEPFPIVITGESGVGKSALLANWSQRFVNHHPEDLVVVHFVGSSAASTNFSSMISRIMEEMRKKLGKLVADLQIPKGAVQLTQEFPLWLSKATSVAGGRRVVLVIDGLDKLDDVDNALDLLWLPREFPDNVRILLSTLPGRPLNAMKKRNHVVLNVESLPEWERISFIRTYLNWH